MKAALPRHLLSVALLSCMVSVAVPVWIARRYGVAAAFGAAPGAIALQLAGVGVLWVGLLHCPPSLRPFAGEGEGTLALLSPPHGVWALAFGALSVVYIPLAEEP